MEWEGEVKVSVVNISEEETETDLHSTWREDKKHRWNAVQ